MANDTDGTADVTANPNRIMQVMDESVTPPRLHMMTIKEADIPTTCTTKHYFAFNAKGEKCQCGKYGNPA